MNGNFNNNQPVPSTLERPDIAGSIKEMQKAYKIGKKKKGKSTVKAAQRRLLGEAEDQSITP